MKLIRAHVFNFGKFHEYDIDFNDGLNPFMFENGWGKTTLAVFIKAMFYGMVHTNSKDLSKNEKLRYFPWQGGTYGGKLEFSNQGKKYEVSRTFSKRVGEDTFVLRNLETNMISNDFQAENLGEKLFGVSRYTYERSIHVTLDHAPAGSGDISAKLNNLVEDADVSNFDKAIESLSDNAKKLKPSRGQGGEIDLTQNKIDENRSRLTDIDSKISQNEEYEKKIAEINRETSELKKERDSVD